MLKVALAITILTAGVLVSESRGEDWPRWRGPRGDGTWQGPTLPQRWPDAGLGIVWRRPIGGGYAGIVVTGGRAYTMDRQTNLPTEAADADANANNDTAPDEPTYEVERVICFDAANGEIAWSDEYDVTYGDLDHGNGPRAAPTVADGHVYTLGTMGDARCLDARDGKVIWSRQFVEEFAAELPDWGLAASPLVWGDMVIFHAGASPGGAVVALDRQTGAERWRGGDDPAGYATPIVIQRDGERQLVCWSPENVLGLSLEDGTVLWRVPYEVTYGVSIATPVFHRGVLLVTGYWEGSKAIRPAWTAGGDVELIWEDNRNLRGLMSQPLCRDGYAYSLDRHHGLTCFEIATGEKLWTDDHQMTPRGRNPQATLVWLGDGERVIILNAEGELILARLTPDGYDEQSRTKLIGPTWAHPAYAGRLVYARDDNEIKCARLVAE